MGGGGGGGWGVRSKVRSNLTMQHNALVKKSFKKKKTLSRWHDIRWDTVKHYTERGREGEVMML